LNHFAIYMVLFALAFMVGLPLVVSFLQMLAFSFCKVKPVSEDEAMAIYAQAAREVSEKFTQQTGFRKVGVYRVHTWMGQPLAAMWQHGNEPTYIAALFVAGAKQIHTDFVSVLSWEKKVGLTTASARDGHVVPRSRRSRMQTFSGITLRQLWERHQDGEAAMADHFGIMPEPIHLTAGEVLERTLKNDGKRVLGRPWLLLLVVYRFWIGKYLMHGKTVRQQLGR